MKDEFAKARKKRKKDQLINARFLVFAAAVVVLFGVLSYGLFQLQIINGEQYAESTGSQSIKTIAIKGSRGMITDTNSVVLAMSEKAYNVTFYRESNDWDYPTPMILEAIEIIERYGSSLSVSAPLRRNAETGQWEYNFGDGISDSAFQRRKELFYSNNFLNTSLDTAEKCFTRLRQRYGFTALPDGTYALYLDKNGNSVVTDKATPDTAAVVSTRIVDEETVLKVMAVNSTMQDNAFNSLPVAIADNVPYDAVSEIEGKSMTMPWIGVEVGEKRVYPNGSLASTIIGYTGKIQNATRYYNELQPAGYALNDTIGLDGVEASMENWLTACITERLYKYAAQMGMASKTGIDLPGELRSIVGNQTNLYDQTVSLKEQMTDTPIIVANAIKRHLINYGASMGIEYDTARLDRCIKLLMDMAINTGSDDWVANARPIFMTELNMTRSMVMQAALMRDLWTYLNTIKWGGSQEIQLGIGQSITLLTPIAVVRYVGALATDAVVWNPQIIDSIVSPEGEVLSQRTAIQFNVLESAKPYLPYILEGMKGVVDEGGTAAKFLRGWKYQSSVDEVMAGKTGTAQVTIGGIKLDLENNAWFVALTPKDDPELAIVSFIPNGYAGAQCVPAVRDFVGYYLDEKAKAKEEIDLPGGNALAP